jgi:hypothetical protein
MPKEPKVLRAAAAKATAPVDLKRAPNAAASIISQRWRVFTAAPSETASAWAALGTHVFVHVPDCNAQTKHTDPNCPRGDWRYASRAIVRAYAKGQEPVTCTQCPACAGGAYAPPGLVQLQGARVVLLLSGDVPPLALPPAMKLVSLQLPSMRYVVHDAHQSMCARGLTDAWLSFGVEAQQACRSCPTWRATMLAVEATRLPSSIKAMLYAMLQ